MVASRAAGEQSHHPGTIRDQTITTCKAYLHTDCNSNRFLFLGPVPRR